MGRQTYLRRRQPKDAITRTPKKEGLKGILFKPSCISPTIDTCHQIRQGDSIRLNQGVLMIICFIDLVSEVAKEQGNQKA